MLLWTRLLFTYVIFVFHFLLHCIVAIPHYILYTHTYIYIYIYAQTVSSELERMESEKANLSSEIKGTRINLQKLHSQVHEEKEVLQSIRDSVSKGEGELNRVCDMKVMEQTDLDRLQAKHAQDVDRCQQKCRQVRNFGDRFFNILVTFVNEYHSRS